MNSHILSAENLMNAFPQVLKNDAKLAALASSIADVLAKRREEIGKLLIYSRIDELPEDLLDILAYDFKVDWWDYGYTVEQKRQTLKDSWHVHRHLGTKYAVETAISAIYPNTVVQEWFEYAGDPYTFRLLINASNMVIDIDFHTRVLELAEYYKNLRSQLSEIEYTIEANDVATFRLGGQVASVVCIYIPELADEFFFDDSVHLGGQVSSIASLPIPNVPDEFAFEAAARVGGRLGTVASINLPSVSDAIEFRHSGRVGGRVANITTIMLPNPQDE